MAVTEEDAGRGGEIGLAELYLRYRRWLTAVVRRQGGGEGSEDIVQEAYARVARMPAGEAVAHPKALLLTVARHLLADDRRRAARDAAAGRGADLAGVRPEPAGDRPFEAVLLKQVILSLPERYRDVFVMHRFGGMSYEAIAKARGLSVKAVEYRVTRAMALCAAKLAE